MTDGGATSSDATTGGTASAGASSGGSAAASGRAAGGSARGRIAAPIAVRWDERQRLPSSFVWRRRRYRIERVLEVWVVETGWWKEAGPLSRSYWRVRAEGRVFDLRYDRIAKAWALEQALS